jgi:exopolyphosphatase/guanosine-5'-triphosphate,3'-diphosphate pyrophosphatase
MTTIGAIDAGSNAIRVVIARLAATGSNELVRIEAERVPVRLGHHAFTTGTLTDATIDAAVAAFVKFRARFDEHGVKLYRAVATSALRTATNRAVLLHRLRHEAKIELEVIDGEEEARLVRAAVLNAMGTQATPRLILDLGGGSLEVNVRNDATWRGTSLPVGTVRLMETFGLEGRIGDAEAAMVRRYAATLMRPLEVACGPADATAVVTGGNAEALAKIFGDGHPTTPSFDVEDLERGLPELIGSEVDDRMSRLGIKRDRAEVIGIAALVFASVARQLGVRTLVSPGVGVREGLLLELAETARVRQVKEDAVHGRALLAAARAFAARVDHDTTHGEHVRTLASALFHQLRDVHGLSEDRGVLLEVAALLHDVGEVVNPKGHHKHSEYMIMRGQIAGLVDDDREMVALMARCHRNDPARIRALVAATSLSKPQRAELRRLIGLLRLADSLDSAHRSRVEQVLCTRMGDAILLDVVVRGAPSSRDATELIQKCDFLAEQLGLDVRITVAPATGEAAAT